jgi:Icc-related predicted phosphoesterase
MVKLLILSDIHSQNITLVNILQYVQKLKEPPIYCLVAGDITNFGTTNELNNILRLIMDNFSKVFFVLGNCDSYIIREELETSAIYLESNIHEIEFFKVVGFGTHKPKLNQKMLNKLRKSKDRVCLLTHAPPHNTRVDMVSLNRHAGSIDLRNFIEKNSHIFLVVSGHIHDSPAITKLNSCTLVNPGPVTRGNFAIIEIKQDFQVDGKIYNIHEK